MKILVTGGAGYIGSILVPYLIYVGKHEVCVLDNFIHGQNSLAALCAEPGFHVVNGDCRDSFIVRPLLEDADIIISLAAIVGAPACARDRGAAETTNVDAVKLICNFARDDQWIIFPNSNSGYGVNTDGICTEDSPMDPISHYGRTKLAAEEAVMERGNSISFRLATVFGASPRHRIDLLCNDFVYRAVVDKSLTVFEGHFRRNFVHVRDVARAFLHAIDHFDGMKGRVYNVGDKSANMSKGDLCEKIEEQVPGFEWFDGDGTDQDKRDYLVSTERIEATGWKPAYTLDQGIAELIRLYQMISRNRYSNA
jgi:nucleoside-diphosphate-sugar epimerase